MVWVSAMQAFAGIPAKITLSQETKPACNTIYQNWKLAADEENPKVQPAEGLSLPEQYVRSRAFTCK